MYIRNGINMQKVSKGTYRLSIRLKGVEISKRYSGYSKKDAYKDFLESVYSNFQDAIIL